ncbi:MAG: hypothetical protein DGJ47_001154 [Rickettsiaceae bacterium]
MITKYLDPKNDICFKHIFGSEKNKDILIHFINDIMDFKGDDTVLSVRFLPTDQNPRTAIDKQSILDVLCKTQDGQQIIIEMQVARTKGFEKRAQYYASKAYCGQLKKSKKKEGKEKDEKKKQDVYDNLKSVIFIAITNHVMFEDKKDYISRHVILDQKTKEHDLDAFSFTFVELPKFKKTKINQLNNMVEKWCYFFKYAEETHEKDIDKISGNNDVIRQAYEEVNQFNWSEEDIILYERAEKTILDNDSASALKEEEAEKRGKAEGEAQIVQNMHEQGISVEDIAKFTKLSLNQVKEFLK